MSDGPRPTQTAVRAPAATPGELPPGFTVGEYRIEGIAGRGGMGVVYAAVQPVIEKKVAIKVLNAQLSADVDLVRRFIDEARAVNRIGHENIIDIFSFGQLPDGRQYFVMEYLDGATLAARIERGDLLTEDIPTILGQVCEALEAAHEKKIVHRDLKPENIWVATSGRGRPRVKLLDFGIAKLLETGDRSITDVGTVMGTPHYMSPEQCNGRGVDHRTDIYALGVMMYRLFAGQLPIRGETYAEILAKQLTMTPPPPSTLVAIPDALDRLIVSCLEKDPAARPQSAGELATALAEIFGPSGLSGPNALSGPRGVGLANLATLPPAPAAESTILASSTAPPVASASPVTAASLPAPSGGAGRTLVAAAVIVVAALVAGWFLLRTPGDGGPAASAPPPSLPSPVAPPAVPPSAAATPEPSVATPPTAPALGASSATAPPRAKAETPQPARQASRRDAPARAEAPTPGPSPAPTKKPHERAANTGLVTDNPFE